MNKLLLLPLLFLAGCTHSIHMVHTDGFNAGPVNETKDYYVEATGTQDVIFFFAFDTDFVDIARKEIEEKCPGRLSAVTTQYSTSHGFMNWTNKVLIKGLCRG